MEDLFGTSFAHVRIHDDSASHRAARALSAAAFTIGSGVHFGRGRYQPESASGAKLLAHELAHTIQQHGALRSTERTGSESPLHEAEAARAADRVSTHQRAEVSGRLGQAVIQRQPDPAGPNVAVTQGVPKEKWDPFLESLYRDKGGDFERANAIRSCRTNGGAACARLLSPREVQRLYDLARSAQGDKAKIESGIRGAVPSLGLLAPMPQLAEGLAPGLTPGAAGAGAGAGVATAVGAGALVAVCVLAAVELWQLGRFETALRDEGFVILDDPLGYTICHGCHSPATSYRRPMTFPDLAPSPSDAELIRRYLDESKAAPEAKPVPRAEPNTKEEEEEPCSLPTGLTQADAIPISWFKPIVDDWYPAQITLRGRSYSRDVPSRLPTGEPIGVASRYRPRPGKVVQLTLDCGQPRSSELCPNASRFRAVLARNGFDWAGLQADHVQDVQWGAPDAASLDVFENLWPMDESANTSAGTLQNQLQPVAFCDKPKVGPEVRGPIQTVKGRAFGRFFKIQTVSRGPALSPQSRSPGTAP